MQAAGALCGVAVGCSLVGGEEEEESEHFFTGGASYTAAWDPFFLVESGSNEHRYEPIGEDASGTRIPFAACQLEGPPYAWRPFLPEDQPLEIYLTGAVGRPDLVARLDVPMSLEPYGRVPDFDWEGLVGQRFQVDRGSLSSGSRLYPNSTPVGEALFREPNLNRSLEVTFSAVDLDATPPSIDLHVNFRDFLDAPDNACELLAARATISETGELWWSTDRLEVPTPEGSVVVLEPALHAGFLYDETYEVFHGAGGEVRGVLDGRHLLAYSQFPEEWLAEGPVDQTTWCRTGEDPYSPCHDCIGDGVESCTAIAYHIIELEQDDPLDEAVPRCGFDFLSDPEDGDVRSEVDPAILGCTTAERRLGPWLLALLLVGLRRSRSGTTARVTLGAPPPEGCAHVDRR